MQTFSNDDYTFDVTKLWELSEDFDVETVELSELLPQLEGEC